MALVKLKIESFQDAACTKKLSSIAAIINPENYSQDYSVRYGDVSTIGNSKKTKAFSRVEDFRLSFKKLLVDGTGIVPLPEDIKTVDDYITKFRSVVANYNGIIHQPPYLKVTWGKLIFKGVCTSMKVDYNLFKPDGTALRAFIDIDIAQTTDPQTKSAQAANSSPDLSHLRHVTHTDTLPLMTYHIYGDSRYYLDVAEKNKMNSVYDMIPGKKLMFPPLKK
jgi:hypothetical protein